MSCPTSVLSNQVSHIVSIVLTRPYSRAIVADQIHPFLDECIAKVIWTS